MDVRVKVPALYVDEIRASDPVAAVVCINKVPENGETGVPLAASIALQVVGTTGVALDAVTKIYITRSSTGAVQLAVDLAAGGLQPGFTGAWSARHSIGSPVVDEQLFSFEPSSGFSSLETVEVKVQTQLQGSGTVHESIYSFTVLDVTPPEIVEVRWLSPTQVLIGFDETLHDDSIFCVYASDGATLESGACVLRGQTLQGSLWLQSFFSLRGSDTVGNNRTSDVTSINVDLTLEVSRVVPAGAALVDDDGRDFDEQGMLLRTRKVRAGLCLFRLEPRLSDETGQWPEDSIQVAYVPAVKQIEWLTEEFLPPLATPHSYVMLTFDEEVSFGRQYRFLAYVGDMLGNWGTAQYDFETPEFGLDLAKDVGFWTPGVLAQTDMQQDIEDGDGLLRKLAMVNQDALNILRYRAGRLDVLDDPWECPENALEYLLSDLGNPFNFLVGDPTLMRRGCEFLPDLYRTKGTGRAQDLYAGIEGFIRGVLRIEAEVVAFQTGVGWVLDDPVWSNLGHTTMLWPGDAYARNCWEIVTATDLTTFERDAIREIGEWADPMGMHLVNIIEPWMIAAGMVVIPGQNYWILGTSLLGTTTVLSP